MKVTIKSEQELIEVATEAIHILNNLRHFTKKWNETHGYDLKQRKIYYEGLADVLLQKLQVTEHRQSNQIKIEITQ